MLNEIGQPTHAFDLDKLEGGKIIVRRARAGEIITTLDGVERKLTARRPRHRRRRKAVALAGVMGGDETMITYATKNVLIESAWFDPASIRRTARASACTPTRRTATSVEPITASRPRPPIASLN